MAPTQLVDDPSPARRFVRELVRSLGAEGAHEAIDIMADKIPLEERADLDSLWAYWARSKQMPPEGRWRTWGFLTARGFGKTAAISHWANTEAEDGRITRLGVAAQDEENTILVNILGPVGLIATAPPWFKPEWEAGAKILHWPNGAQAIVRTPEVPGKIRGFEYDAAWLSELQSWPTSKREEAMSNFRLATRIGLARIVWDATPKRGHPILKELIADAERDPSKHTVVRGTTYENIHALAEGYVEEEERRIGGTRAGREELHGEMLDDSERAIAKAEWFVRVTRPDRVLRRSLGLDAAVTERKGNDQTGIIDAGLGLDGRAYIFGDYTDTHTPNEWGDLVIEKYFLGRCDCVVVERNKAGDLITQNLRLIAQMRKITVLVLEKDQVPRHQPRVIYIREVYAKGPKEDRAKALSTAYEKKRVCHVLGADLEALEEVLTTWEPEVGMRSPDRLDAEVHVVGELLNLAVNKRDAKGSIQTALAINQRLQKILAANPNADDRI